MLKSLLTLLVLLLSFQVFSQEMPQPEEDKPVFFEQPTSSFKQKMHYGGNVWAGFLGSFYVDVSPMAGYEITDKGTIAGLGATFIYQGGFNQGGTAMAGPRIFIRQAIWRSIFAHAEYELINAPRSQFYSFNGSSTLPGEAVPRKWEGSPLIGAGFYQGRSREQKGSFISVMYNIGYSYNRGLISPQGLGGNDSPFLLRFGFFF
jgi:hypothetical protein